LYYSSTISTVSRYPSAKYIARGQILKISAKQAVTITVLDTVKDGEEI